jgi:hypothetical protein
MDDQQLRDAEALKETHEANETLEQTPSKILGPTAIKSIQGEAPANDNDQTKLATIHPSGKTDETLGKVETEGTTIRLSGGEGPKLPPGSHPGGAERGG